MSTKKKRKKKKIQMTRVALASSTSSLLRVTFEIQARVLLLEKDGVSCMKVKKTNLPKQINKKYIHPRDRLEKLAEWMSFPRHKDGLLLWILEPT